MTLEFQYEEPESDKPPQKWHDAIRNNLTGILYSHGRFETFSINVNGLIYNIESVTQKESLDGDPEGIYVYTNIVEERKMSYRNLMEPVVTSLRKLFLEESGGKREYTKITPEINPELADKNLMIDFGNSIRIGVYRVSKGNLVFYVKPMTLDNARHGKIVY